MSKTERAEQLAQMNDQFRLSLLDPHGPHEGRLLITRGIQAFPVKSQLDLIVKVMHYRDFTEDSDPYKEHDFGVLMHEGFKIFFKIDVYESSEMEYGSEDPLDPDKSYRVLTIMLASEY
jgi:hypothetical protein